MNAERDFGLASVVFGIALGYSRAAASNAKLTPLAVANL
jgi:hypothetical protein